MPFPYRDNRDFIADLKKTGDVQLVEKEVNWNLEAGAILRRCYELGLPAPFFQKITDYGPGFRIFGGPLGSHRRVAISWGLDPDTHLRDLMEEYLKRSDKRVKPRIVAKKNAPCKENIDIGDKVDLLKFPAPMVHEGDGGRYMCTWHAQITKDPDSGWVNYGMYRAMVHTKDSLGGLLWRYIHIGDHYFLKYVPKGQPMPCAIAIGMDPVTSMTACTRIPYGVDEIDVAGGLRGEPVDLVKCETIDLYVPATSEIVIECEVSPTERQWEGPFGEFTGYRASPRDRRPVYRVKAVTYRNDPILTMSCMGMPIDDSDACLSTICGAEMLQDLRREGIPVKDLCFFPHSSYSIVAVSVKVAYSNIAHRVADIIWGGEAGKDLPYVIVVEDDVDPHDIWQVIHVIGHKCHPYRGIHRSEVGVAHGLEPFLSRHERLNQLGAKCYFDCTWPTDWDPAIAVPPRASFDNIYPKALQEHVMNNWAAYGFKAGIPKKGR